MLGTLPWQCCLLRRGGGFSFCCPRSVGKTKVLQCMPVHLFLLNASCFQVINIVWREAKTEVFFLFFLNFVFLLQAPKVSKRSEGTIFSVPKTERYAGDHVLVIFRGNSLLNFIVNSNSRTWTLVRIFFVLFKLLSLYNVDAQEPEIKLIGTTKSFPTI